MLDGHSSTDQPRDLIPALGCGGVFRKTPFITPGVFPPEPHCYITEETFRSKAAYQAGKEPPDDRVLAAGGWAQVPPPIQIPASGISGLEKTKSCLRPAAKMFVCEGVGQGSHLGVAPAGLVHRAGRLVCFCLVCA